MLFLTSGILNAKKYWCIWSNNLKKLLQICKLKNSNVKIINQCKMYMYMIEESITIVQLWYEQIISFLVLDNLLGIYCTGTKQK